MKKYSLNASVERYGSLLIRSEEQKTSEATHGM